MDLDYYKFVWLAWGSNNIAEIKKDDLMEKYPGAITVHKLNYRNTTKVVQYPVHPLYMNEGFFLEAAAGRITP